MSCMLLYGDSGMGKTMILEKMEPVPMSAGR
jgi:predicted ATPase with chaperone activity